MRYTRIIFLQGDDAVPLIDYLYDREDEVVYGGATQRRAHRAAGRLADMANEGINEGITTDEPSAGTGDGTWQVRLGGHGYILTAHLGRGYIGLERKEN